MEIGSSKFSSDLYEELWRACAGPLVHLPQTGERVFYFPQGHLDQVAALTNEKLNETLPVYNLPSKILCRVVNIDPRVAETDEVYAQITLFPEYSQDDDVDNLDHLLPECPKPSVKSFYKKLTTTDIRGKLHVKQQDAKECFPPLDMTQETPSQELVAIDLHGISWQFKHAFTGNPKRHVLTAGWKRFATKKRLVSGDSIIFIRGENGELRVGIRHVLSQKSYMPHCYLASGKSRDLFTNVLATAFHALATNTLFTVFYRPSGRSQFIVGKYRYMECAKKLWSIGLRFSMRFEGEDHIHRRFNGSIIEVGDVSSSWTDSKWRCLKVKWDDYLATMRIRPERVSPWEIDLHMEQTYIQQHSGIRDQAKKTGQPSHLSSAREINMMNMTQMAIDPLISSQQYWIQNVGQPHWTSVHQMCVQPSYQQQTNNIPTGPLLSNEDNWFQYIINDMEIPDQHVSVNDAGQGSHDQCDLLIPGHDKALQLDELGQIFNREENGGLNTIIYSQFPTVSPTIHFTELQGEKVSVNSEESVQGVTRKRKTTSVGEVESENDDRQVKCRIESSQCGVGSDSNETHYSSASEGEPSTGKCSQDLPSVERTGNGSERGFIYRVWDWISGSLLHQLRNNVAK